MWLVRLRAAILSAHHTKARRKALAWTALGVITLGLATRFGLPGSAGDAAGGIFYAALVYVLIAFSFPARPPATTAVAAFAWSAAIELLQLTSVPADLGDRFAPLHLVFGSSFVATDLVAYAVGAVLAAYLDTALQRRHHRPAG